MFYTSDKGSLNMTIELVFAGVNMFLARLRLILALLLLFLLLLLLLLLHNRILMWRRRWRRRRRRRRRRRHDCRNCPICDHEIPREQKHVKDIIIRCHDCGSVKHIKTRNSKETFYPPSTDEDENDG